MKKDKVHEALNQFLLDQAKAMAPWYRKHPGQKGFALKKGVRLNFDIRDRDRSDRDKE